MIAEGRDWPEYQEFGSLTPGGRDPQTPVLGAELLAFELGVEAADRRDGSAAKHWRPLSLAGSPGGSTGSR
jgi:hypothetical protein